MNYVNLTTSNFGSDVAVFREGKYYLTMVARARLPIRLPLAPFHWLPQPEKIDGRYAWRSFMHKWVALVGLEVFAAWDWVVKRLAVLIPPRRIGGRYDGNVFCDNDALACIQRLRMLESNGYRIPRVAIERLRAECATR